MQERAAYILLNMEYSHPSRTLFLLSLARLLGQGLSHLTQPCRRRNPKPKAPFKKRKKKKEDRGLGVETRLGHVNEQTCIRSVKVSLLITQKRGIFLVYRSETIG